LIFGFFFLNKICDGGILEKKKKEEKVKMIELQQFESLGKEGGGMGSSPFHRKWMGAVGQNLRAK
jgi:hypothetical protein